MLSFSQRMGLNPVRTEIQRESADIALRNELWNIVFSKYIKFFPNYAGSSNNPHSGLVISLWTQYFGYCLDELPESYEIIPEIKNIFLTSNWHIMFDLLEFMPNHLSTIDGSKNAYNDDFINTINTVFEKHLSAYRFVNYQIVEITSDVEIAAIETAIVSSDTNEPVKIHLSRALELLSDRKNPDYRNSIKESISAIEAYAQIITNNSKAKLSDALKEIERNYELHEALKKSFSSLYGYTSDADGIRHNLLNESSLKQEDALFMLVTCSAFINYLKVKTSSNPSQQFK